MSKFRAMHADSQTAGLQRSSTYLVNDLWSRVQHLEEEIHLLRCLEDSYDSKDDVIAQVFLKLNELCDDIA